ncbi:MAG: STAS domain-containing protein [Ilumatobacteraceae bacterium]
MTDSTEDDPGLVRLVVRGSTLTISGELDASNSDALSKAINELAPGDRTVVTTSVSFIDCAALSTLMSAARACRTAGSRLVLSRPSWAVERLVELTDATELFSIQR